MKLKANAYIADELSHKVKVLTQALEQTREIILKLEKENERLLAILDTLSQKN
jgi:hypothetical protein